MAVIQGGLALALPRKMLNSVTALGRSSLQKGLAPAGERPATTVEIPVRENFRHGVKLVDFPQPQLAKVPGGERQRERQEETGSGEQGMEGGKWARENAEHDAQGNERGERREERRQRR